MAWVLAAHPNWKPPEWHSAYGALLDNPGDSAVQPLFQENAGHERGDAEAEIDGFAVAELERGATGDHLLQAPLGQLECFGGDAHLAADGGVVVGLGGLHGVGDDHDGVDENAGHAHVLGEEGAGGDAAFDLGDDDAAVVVGGQGDIVGPEKGAFALEGEIAQLVGCGRPNQSYVRVQGAQIEPLLTVKLHQLHDIFAGALVHTAALAPWIEVGVHAQLGEDAGAFGRGLAQLVEDETAGNIVGFDFVFVDHAPDGG